MKAAVIGRKGFIGSALAKKLDLYGYEIQSFPTKDTDILYHFGSPVHPPFEENPDYHMQEILSSFMYLLPFCRDNNIRFVYPSSALVYEKYTFFAKSKKIMEVYASCYPNTLGLRIFPVYGPGENRTAIYNWCSAMKKGLSPLVYGDGKQERDFIYIDDAVDAILSFSGIGKETISFQPGVKDIGIGEPVSFNFIIDAINDILDTKILPTYTYPPDGYSEGIVCKNPVPRKTSITQGLRNVLNAI